MAHPEAPPANFPLNRVLTADEIARYGKYNPIQYRDTLSRRPKTLRQLRNANASMNALRATNDSFFSISVKRQNARNRMRTPTGAAGISMKEELQQKYASPERLEAYSRTVGAEPVNIAEEFQEGGPFVEGVGTGQKTYPVFAPIRRGGKRRRITRKRRRSNRKSRRI